MEDHENWVCKYLNCDYADATTVAYTVYEFNFGIFGDRGILTQSASVRQFRYRSARGLQTRKTESQTAM